MAIAAKHKQTIHHKRTRGQHHKRDEHYLKAYHPYLPLLLLVIVALAINIFWTAQTKVLGASTTMTTQELLVDTNQERSRQHETDLAINSKLSAAAQAKANDMVNRDYWAHNTPDGKTPWAFLKNSGYTYQIAGENLAHGFLNAHSVVAGWMNSPEHRENLLNDDYEEVGFGIATSDNFQGKGKTTLVVALYATPDSSATASAAGQAGNGIGTFASAQTYRPVSRIELLSGGRAPWIFASLVVATMFAATIFIVRHAKAWHRLLARGEDFVLHHRTLDFIVVSVVLLGVIMTRTSGFIG